MFEIIGPLVLVDISESLTHTDQALNQGNAPDYPDSFLE